MWFTIRVAFAVILIFTGLNDHIASAHGDDMEDHDKSGHTHDSRHATVEQVAVEITIGPGGYQLRRDGKVVEPEVLLMAGRPAVFTLRNEDSVPHDFISALFTRIEVHFTGRATGIFRKEAAGFRLKPGDNLTLQFIAPFSDFRSMYDLIWCSHNMEHPPERRELLIVVTEDKQPGS